MKIENAIKKLNKAGFLVTRKGHQFSARHPESPYLVEFCQNGQEDKITCVGFRLDSDQDDFNQDYRATIYANNITNAIKLALC